MEISREAKQEQIDIINDKIKFWTDFGNSHMDNCNVDIYDILDDLYRQKQDVIYGTHSYTCKQISKKIKDLENQMANTSFIKKNKIKKQIYELHKRLFYFIDLDSIKKEDNIEKFEKQLKK